MDVGLGLMAEADTEAAVAAVQDHYFVSGLDNTHSYWREGSRSIVGDPLEKAFVPLQTIFETPQRIERSWFAIAQRAAVVLGCSSSETFLAAEKLQIYSRMPHLFDRRMHDRNCLDGYSCPAGPHNLPCLRIVLNSISQRRWRTACRQTDGEGSENVNIGAKATRAELQA